MAKLSLQDLKALRSAGDPGTGAIVFGQIKDVRGFDRFMRQGFETRHSEWSGVCVAQNLLKLWQSGKARWN